MHFVKVKGILSSNNGMNLYRGCTHGCIYCDSRSKCYQINHLFEDIEVKENSLELLETALIHKRKKCMIGTGSMSDPYMPLENSIMYTRKALEIIYKYGFGVSLITKSNLILRDLDILKKINERAKVVVSITLTTYDETLCKILEPNVCTTKERFEVLKVLNENGIKTIVWLDPILPFINDTVENLEGIMNYCIEAHVYGIMCFGFGLTLREGNREYFYQNLDQNFKGLKEKYIKYYGDNYMVNSFNNDKLMKIFKDKCIKNNIECDCGKLFKYMIELDEDKVQLKLFD